MTEPVVRHALEKKGYNANRRDCDNVGSRILLALCLRDVHAKPVSLGNFRNDKPKILLYIRRLQRSSLLQGRGLLPVSGEGRYSAAARRIIWSRPSRLRDAWCWLAMRSCPVVVGPTLKNFFTMTHKGT